MLIVTAERKKKPVKKYIDFKLKHYQEFSFLNYYYFVFVLIWDKFTKSSISVIAKCSLFKGSYVTPPVNCV